MKPQLSRSRVVVGCAVAGLLSPTAAWALDCDEMTRMVNIGVGSELILKTMVDSGEAVGADTVACLEERNASADLIAGVRAFAGLPDPSGRWSQDNSYRLETTQSRVTLVSDLAGAPVVDVVDVQGWGAYRLTIELDGREGAELIMEPGHLENTGCRVEYESMRFLRFMRTDMPLFRRTAVFANDSDEHPTVVLESRRGELRVQIDVDSDGVFEADETLHP